MSVVSLGALACTLRIASMSARGRGFIVLLGSTVLGLVIVASALTESAWLSFLLLLCIGAGQSRPRTSGIARTVSTDLQREGRATPGVLVDPPVAR
jgi:hypothetical protein